VRTRTITKAGAVFEVGDDDAYRRFWDWYELEDWEPETVAAFDRCLRPETRYVDLGAWIGTTVLLAATRVARVVCAEPDPLAYAVLAENLALNPSSAAKTVALRVAAGGRDGTITLTAADEGGRSLSSVVRRGDAGARWQVELVSFRTLLERGGLDGADFVKIDVEGAEYELLSAPLPGRPTLFLATHPNFLLDKSSVASRAASAIRALRANRRMLRALLAYRHHYVYEDGRFRDIRVRNVLRVVLPLPLRSSFLIGACVFTDETLS
jgi:FkbM family methyltransferase